MDFFRIQILNVAREHDFERLSLFDSQTHEHSESSHGRLADRTTELFDHNRLGMLARVHRANKRVSRVNSENKSFVQIDFFSCTNLDTNNQHNIYSDDQHIINWQGIYDLNNFRNGQMLQRVSQRSSYGRPTLLIAKKI
jgi:hypothetical protein